MNLIDKDTLVAEIEKLKKSHDNWSYMGKCFHQEYENLLSFINTLEMKEVDLEKEINAYMVNEMKFLSDEVGYDTLLSIAKHFFELGVQQSKNT